jgi:hypothetical protein
MKLNLYTALVCAFLRFINCGIVLQNDVVSMEVNGAICSSVSLLLYNCLLFPNLTFLRGPSVDKLCLLPAVFHSICTVAVSVKRHVQFCSADSVKRSSHVFYTEREIRWQ